jgi:hypothetical protein
MNVRSLRARPSRARAALVLWAAAIVGAGCPTTETPNTGAFERPSGLAVLPRTDTRTDLVVADAEAGGLRFVQLSYAPPDSGTQRPVYKHVFERAAAQYFSLVVPTGRFPTRVTAARDGSHVFALSSVDATITRVTTPFREFGAGDRAPGDYVADAAVSLASLPSFEGLPLDVVALDPAWLGRSGDLLALLVDRPSGRGEIIFVAVAADAGAEVVARVEVGASPRDLAVREVAPLGLWASSAADATITFVPMTAGATAPGAPETIDVGGPTGSVVDAAESGAVALRLDVAAVAFVDLVDGRLVRSERTFVTPAGPIDGSVGRAELLALPAAAGLGYVSFLPRRAASSTNLLEPADYVSRTEFAVTSSKAPVVLVACADGSAELFAGRPLRPIVDVTSRLTRVAPLVPKAGEGGVVGLALEASQLAPRAREGCTLATSETTCVQRATATVVTSTACSVAGVQSSAGGPLELHAAFRGALLDEASALVTRTSSARVDVRPRFASAEARLVRAGDQVALTVSASEVCDASIITDLYAVAGVVTAVRGATLTAALDPMTPLRGTCPVLEAVTLRVTPADDAVVVQRYERDRLTSITERIAPVAVPDGFDFPLTRGVRMTLHAPSMPTCLDDVPQLGCKTGRDCGARALCSRTADQLRADCSGVCVNLTNEPAYPVCPRVELTARSATTLRAPANFSISADTTRLPVQARLPDDVAFSSSRNGWYVSFTAGRSVVELVVSPLANGTGWSYETTDLR